MIDKEVKEIAAELHLLARLIYKQPHERLPLFKRAKFKKLPL